MILDPWSAGRELNETERLDLAEQLYYRQSLILLGLPGCDEALQEIYDQRLYWVLGYRSFDAYFEKYLGE